MNKIFMPFMEEDNGTNVGAGDAQPVENTGKDGFQFDYDKLASIIDGRTKATEDSVLKGYFKEQGLTGDEMKQAVEMFKQDRASRQPDYDALNAQIAEMDDELLEASSRVLFAETQMEAMAMASELGVDHKTVPYLIKMADLSDVITDGQVDHDKLKESLSDVLNDLPQLRATSEEKSHGFRVGGDGGDNKSAENTDLAKIFGVKK